jgi:hypothetical protein
MRKDILFRLDSYVDTTQFYYYFFDGLFKKEEELKKDILEKLNIPSSTYRTNRQTTLAKNDNHIILLNYFKINPIDDSFKVEYDYLLSNIYLCLYFRKIEEIPSLSNKLEEYILQNNAYKPLFILFRILIKMLGYKTYNETLIEIKEDADYLSIFPLQYFHDEFQTLYKFILLYLGDSQLAGKDSYSDTAFPELSWMYYQILSIIDYSRQYYTSAIINSLEAEKFYLQDFNFTRYFVTRNNIAAFYGYLDNYRASIATLKPIMHCVIYQWTDKNLTKLVISQYLYALIMNECLDDILLFLDSIKLESQILSSFSLIIAVLAYYLKGITKETFKENFYQILKDDSIAYEFFLSLFEKKQINKDFVKKYKNIEKIAKKYKFVKW